MPDHVDFYLNFLQKFWRGQKVICALQNHKTIASSKLQKCQVLQSIVLQTFWRGQKVICALQNHKTSASSKLQKSKFYNQ